MSHTTSAGPQRLLWRLSDCMALAAQVCVPGGFAEQSAMVCKWKGGACRGEGFHRVYTGACKGQVACLRYACSQAKSLQTHGGFRFLCKEEEPICASSDYRGHDKALNTDLIAQLV